MMKSRIGRELERYGRKVTLRGPQLSGDMTAKAMLQPVRDRGAARAVPSALGRVKQGQVIYLGPAEASLAGVCRMEADGVCYEVRNARPVYAGGELTHWWAVLEEVR